MNAARSRPFKSRLAILTMLLVTIGLSACQPACSAGNLSAALDTLEYYEQTLIGLQAEAATASPQQRGAAIALYQYLEGQVEHVGVPQCAEPARVALLDYFDAVIHKETLISQGASGPSLDTALIEADNRYARYQDYKQNLMDQVNP